MQVDLDGACRRRQRDVCGLGTTCSMSHSARHRIARPGGNPRKPVEPDAGHAGTRNCRKLFDARDASYHIGYRLRHQIRDRCFDGRPGRPGRAAQASPLGLAADHTATRPDG
jgi:hypothetical protein